MIALPALLKLLNENYLNQFNTILIGGFSEPFYKAHKGNISAEIQFAHDYIRSALHELSHWCVAGNERRKVDDYGYWYAEDGRNQQQQDEFFKVEIKPQSIEWALSIVCGIKFEASVDNLNANVDGVDKFEQKLKSELKLYTQNGFSKRVTEIIQVISKYQKINNYMTLIKGQLLK